MTNPSHWASLWSVPSKKRTPSTYSGEVITPSPYSPHSFQELDYSPIYQHNVSNVNLSNSMIADDYQIMNFISDMYKTSPNQYLKSIAENTPSWELSKYVFRINDNGIGGRFESSVTGNFEPVDKVVEYFKKLMKNKKIKIIFIFTAVVSVYGNRHANWIIIDKPRKEVEFFDPYGHETTESVLLYGRPSVWAYDMVDLIKNSFQNNINEPKLCFIPKKYNVLRYFSSCPRFGFQYYQENYRGLSNLDRAGYCTIWCLFMLELRLTNKNKTIREIQDELINKRTQKHLFSGNIDKAIGEEFHDFIRRYTYFVEVSSGIRP